MKCDIIGCVNCNNRTTLNHALYCVVFKNYFKDAFYSGEELISVRSLIDFFKKNGHHVGCKCSQFEPLSKLVFVNKELVIFT